MNYETYSKIEEYMLSCMRDGAHDEQHIYRVLHYAAELAQDYKVDIDVLIASALLHDIGRNAQFKNPQADHAIVGSKMAYAYLTSIGWSAVKADIVRKCVRTHRYRKNSEPESIEAKILFDADKLDATGTIGVARTLAYKGIVAEPLYSLDENGRVLDGSKDDTASFFQEYNFKLKNVYGKFYTERAKIIAEERKAACVNFYENMLKEVRTTYEMGTEYLQKYLGYAHDY
jgi:uncharacterized protein